MRMREITNVTRTLTAAGVTPEAADEKAQLLVHGSHVATSGKMASGKDAVADAYEAVIQPQHTEHVSMAKPLKAEVSEIITRFHRADGVTTTATHFSVSTEEMRNAFQLLMGTNPQDTGYTRSQQVRGLLQFWGTDVRRKADPSYWTRLGIQALADAVAPGVMLKITDARFTNEAEMLQSIGIPVVRLEVTPGTQDRRHFARDGIYPDPEKRVHVSETDLDDYADFDLVRDNNEDLESLDGFAREIHGALV